MKKIKKRYLILLTAFLATLLSGIVLSGCTNSKKTSQDIIEDGFTVCVTFDTAGGSWATTGNNTASKDDDDNEGDDNENQDGEDGDVDIPWEDDDNDDDVGTRQELRQIYVKPNSKLSAKSVADNMEAVRSGYTFGAYCIGTKNPDGTVTYGRKWDFATDRVTENITLYAQWLENYYVVAHYGENFELEKRFTVQQDSEGNALPLTSMNFGTEGITIIGIYEDREATKEITVSVSKPYLPPCTAENRLHDVWVKSLEGEWTLVRGRDDFVIYGNSNCYFMVDEIDFGGEIIDTPDVFTGKIYGNGAVVKNFTVEHEVGTDRTARYYGLFRELRKAKDNEEGAVIKDITFENVTYSALLDNQFAPDYVAGAFAGYVSEESVLSNVKVTGTFSFAITTKAGLFEKTDIGEKVGQLEPEGTDEVPGRVLTDEELDCSGIQINKYEDKFPDSPLNEVPQADLPAKKSGESGDGQQEE